MFVHVGKTNEAKLDEVIFRIDFPRIIAKSGGDVILNLKDKSKKIISTASDLLKDEKNRKKAKSIFSSALKQAKKLKKK